MQIEELKKQIRYIDLAVSAGKKRQSPRTGLVHYCLQDDTAFDTIPVFENFCFAFALFRQKTAETILEAKEIIDRLLGFQTEEGNFPVYLHEFPKCWDFHLGLKIAPILIHILRDFGFILQSSYREKYQKAIDRMVQPPKNQAWEARYQACLGRRIPFTIDSFDQIISDQLLDKTTLYPIPYDRSLQAFVGDHFVQERGEPQPLPIEYVLAEKDGFGPRLLADHIHQLYSALLYPFSSSEESSCPFCFQKKGSSLLWKGSSLHSLSISSGVKDGDTFVFELVEGVEIGRDDLFEIALYCDISPETSLWINGQKGMVFSFGDTVSIQTPSLRIDLRFEKIKGQGDFCGHISRANRPGQIACKGHCLYEAYDWQIGLRTLRRQGPCTICCTLHLVNI